MSTGAGSIDDAATVAVTTTGSVSGSPGDAAIGSARVVGRYKIVARIGTGGMATVWSARDDELDRTVAVKLVRAPRRDADVRARMLREAQAMAALSHPHVVQVYDVGVAGDDVWIAMELVSGRTLTQWLGEAPRAWPDVVAAFCHLGRGLAAVHDAGLVHRDFKPHNAMIDDTGRVRLIDFGLARDEGSASLKSHDEADDGAASRDDTLTATGVVMGTPAYMSPEQVEGRAASAASDQFSFCVALFEALHGARPFVGHDRKALMQAIAQGRIDAGGRRPIPGWLEAAVRRGLSRDPAARWPSLAALVDRLEARAAGRRRRGLVLGLGVVVTAGSIVALASRAQERCRDTTLAATWNDAAADRIDAALRATELRYADDAATSVRTELDAYARAWTSAWDEACAAELDPATRDARLACLSRGRRDLEKSLEILGAADPEI